MTDRSLAGVCGLYCGACGIYRMYKDQDTERLERAARQIFRCEPADIRCEGCGGQPACLWTPDCRFVRCVREQGVAFCSECREFPCEDLAAFSAERRDIPLTNLRRLAEVGLAAWLAEQETRWRCPECACPTDITSESCRACGAALPRRENGSWMAS